MQIIRRHLRIDLPPGRSAFLWGPRRVGKTYWLHHHYLTGDEHVIDLLQTDVFAEYATRPALLREHCTPRDADERRANERTARHGNQTRHNQSGHEAEQG